MIKIPIYVAVDDAENQIESHYTVHFDNKLTLAVVLVHFPDDEFAKTLLESINKVLEDAGFHDGRRD